MRDGLDPLAQKASRDRVVLKEPHKAFDYLRSGQIEGSESAKDVNFTAHFLKGDRQCIHHTQKRFFAIYQVIWVCSEIMLVEMIIPLGI